MFIRDRGGRLFVWTQRQAACGRTSLRTQVSFEEPREGDFISIFECEDVKLFLATGAIPAEVTVRMLRFARQLVVAFWPCCMYQ